MKLFFFVLKKTLNTPHHVLGGTLKRPVLKNDIILTKVMSLQSCFIIFKSFTHGPPQKVGLRYFAKRSKWLQRCWLSAKWSRLPLTALNKWALLRPSNCHACFRLESSFNNRSTRPSIPRENKIWSHYRIIKSLLPPSQPPLTDNIIVNNWGHLKAY